MVLEENELKYDYKNFNEDETSKKTKKNKKLRNLILIALTFTLSFTVLFRYAEIYQKSIALNKMEARVNEIINQNQQLKAQIASSTDLQKIEFEAKNKLGMVEPSNNQVVYINAKIDTHKTKNKINDNKENKNIFARFLGLLVR